jgi:glucokinase
MKKYAFGVDIGGTTVKIGLFDKDGNVIDKWEIPTVTEGGPDAILPNVASAITAKMQEHRISADDVEGVGAGSPGAITADGHLVDAVNIGWKELNLSEELSSLLKLPVKASNDANVAAFGEMWKGAGQGCSNMVMVTLGTGVGGGIIVNGQILSGATGGGGEIGHLHVDDEETDSCNCGNKGCLEQYGSATGIVRLAKKRLAQDNTPCVLRGEEITAKSVFDAVKAGDSVAVEIAESFGRYLGKGLGMIASVVNPEVIVIGGGVSKAGDILIKYIEPNFKEYAFPPCSHAKIMLAQLGNDAGIYGAAGLILND